MTMERNNHRIASGPGRAVSGLVLVVSCLILAGAAIAEPIAVAAEFIRDIRMPGLGETILRPSAMHFDSIHDEILVGDPGHSRIVIFSSQGVYKFDFSLSEIMTTPRDITTDPDGFIYVLGSDREGQVVNRFDFDGSSLGRLQVPVVHDGIRIEMRSLACDENGTLYAMDTQGRRILVLDQEGGIVRTISVEHDEDLVAGLADGEANGQGSYAIGTLTCSGSTLYVPISNVGTVRKYSTDGEHLGQVGSFGAKTGFLNFPVAVEISEQGLILVLDRPRFCVVCYSPDGKFLGEFGGKGISPGWFMGPSLISIPSADRAIVGQVFRNKIQICRIPEIIRNQVDQDAPEQTALGVVPQRRSSQISRPNHPSDGEFPSSDFNSAISAQNVSLPEVSE